MVIPEKAVKEDIMLFHTFEYYKKIAETRGKALIALTGDTHACADTFDAALYASGGLIKAISQAGLFPGAGIFTETGIGPGEGYTINLPVPKGYGDAEYISIFERLIAPVAEQFAPELILVSAGFDTHKDDPMGGCR